MVLMHAHAAPWPPSPTPSPLQVETPIIQPFSEALPEADWVAYNKEIKAKAAVEQQVRSLGPVCRLAGWPCTE